MKKTNDKNSDKNVEHVKGTGEQKQERNPKSRGREPYENRPLPGEYPPNEDIMNRKNDTGRVSIDPEKISRSPGAMNREEENLEPGNESRGLSKKRTRQKSDLTKEDYEALGPRDLSLDGGDDEQLKHRVWPVDFAAKDLDVPNGDDERRDAMGQGDEENDHYSLGGDDKDNLEDDPTRTFG